MFLKRFSLIVLLSYSISALADDSVLSISKGTPAPFDGYLINQERAERFRALSIELDFTNKSLDIVKQQNKLLTEQLDLSSKHMIDLNKQITEAKDNSLLSKIGMFILGAGTATLLTFAVSQTIK